METRKSNISAPGAVTQSIALENGTELLVATRADGRVSSAVWPCALHLLNFLLHNNGKEAHWKGRKVIELGSGTGVVGLGLAAEGADVVLTDQPKCMELLTHNAATLTAKLPGAKVRAAALDWRVPD